MYDAYKFLSVPRRMAKQWNPWHAELMHLQNSSVDRLMRVMLRRKKGEKG